MSQKNLPRKGTDHRLPLPSLVIKGFRGLKNLSIPKLSRVTLITGKNGVGKSTVLEAIEVYAECAEYTVLSDLLTSRKELVLFKGDDGENTYIPNCLALFHGRQVSSEAISIGPDMNGLQLKISNSHLTLEETMNLEDRFFREIPFDSKKVLEITKGEISHKLPWGFAAHQKYRSHERFRRTMQEATSRSLGDEDKPMIPCKYIGLDSPDLNELASLWNKIALTENENRTIEALSVVLDLEIERVAFVGSSQQDPLAHPRVLVKLSNQADPVSLDSLGKGALRLLHVILSLVNYNDGLVLIDGPEQELHYSVQDKYWELILRMAREFNIQVIATTHSFDCIKGIAVANERVKQNDTIVIKLYDDGNQIKSFDFDQKAIESAAIYGIEVR